jgi:hypothetical protein
MKAKLKVNNVPGEKLEYVVIFEQSNLRQPSPNAVVTPTGI